MKADLGGARHATVVSGGGCARTGRVGRMDAIDHGRRNGKCGSGADGVGVGDVVNSGGPGRAGAARQICERRKERMERICDEAKHSGGERQRKWSTDRRSGWSSRVVLIPEGTFLVLPVMLQGPCNGSIQLQIDGEVLAPSGEPFANGDHWLAIHRVNNLVVDGQGWLDGQGSSAWPFNNCPTLGICHGLPVSLKFSAINHATIRNIKSVNSKFFHFSVFESQNITFDNVTFVAPDDSPNTDGIHISMSTNINITNSVIGTGDDCISMGPGSKVINITNVQCGPGHGISIGSLGRRSHESDVAEITVRDSVFNSTKNGVRIKSWSTPFPSMVSKIAFINLQMNNVKHPIIIDQSYCPHGSCYPDQMSRSGVQIEDVRYEDIRGTSSSKVALNFDCSQVSPCQGIVLKDINMTLNDGGAVTSKCYNIRGSAFGLQLPPSCLLPLIS